MKKIKLHISDEPHCRELESLGSIFVPLVRGLMSAEDFVEADIMLNWVDIAGEELASFCSPLKVRFNPKDCQRTLFVEVPAGGFALEMQHREGYILEKINAYFGYKAVHRLNVSQNIKMRPRVFVRKKAESEIKLSQNEEKYLNELADGIKDEKLKEILTKLGKSVVLSNRGEK